MEIKHWEPGMDAKAAGWIYVSSWRYAYRGILPDAYLETLAPGPWAEQLSARNDGVLLAMEDGTPVGITTFGAARDSAYEGWGELVSIYLLSSHLGRGMGTALLRAAMGELAKQGLDNTYLWVLEQNHKARRFYEKYGFCDSGESGRLTIEGVTVRELRYIYRKKNALPGMGCA